MIFNPAPFVAVMVVNQALRRKQREEQEKEEKEKKNEDRRIKT